MIAAQRALVGPRVLSPDTGDSVLLEDVVRDLLASRSRGSLCLVGAAGAGKTTALQHLAAIFSSADLTLLDEPTPQKVFAYSHWLALTAVRADSSRNAPIFRLAPWSEDECIEYLLAAHKDRCRSVMSRLRDDEQLSLLQGNPQLLRLVLDELAADETLTSVRSALLRSIEQLSHNSDSRSLVERAGFDLLLPSLEAGAGLAQLKQRGEEALLTILRHRPVQLFLAVAYVMRELHGRANGECLEFRLPRDLVLNIAAEAARQPPLIDLLRSEFMFASRQQAMAASILHAARINWSPEPGSKLFLGGAYLDGIVWTGIRLSSVVFAHTDLHGANLRNAKLDSVTAPGGNFAHADLHGAFLPRINTERANFADADLSSCFARGGNFFQANFERANLQGANLPRASFAKANLTRANLRGANLRNASFVETCIDEANFAEANLTGAVLGGLKLGVACFTDTTLRNADLRKCNLEGMHLPRADFRNANLTQALLTDSTMPNAYFDGANLSSAGLGGIDWEGASLRGADLTGASFHLGSSRSGLVGSPIACEGSRTGFYTDDFTEQDFKAPEEIRKANLCRADLRGARIDGVDFYLVDLRNALIDSQHIDHLRRCGAILKHRGSQARE
jgi:uncharacterized protein YjbI with pentapeptide repeats